MVAAALHRAGWGATEVTRPDGVQLRSEFVGRGTGLNQCQCAAGVLEHIGIRREVTGFAAAGRPGLTERVRDVGGSDIAVAVPLGLALGNADAARLLSEEGPTVLSARRLATESSTSTMAVYTQFGGMPALVRELVTEGFARLRERLAAVEHTDDVLDDLVRLCRAYRENALEYPHIYTVMFGGASLGGYRLSRAEMDVGRDTFTALAEALDRMMGAGLIRRENSRHLAGQCWSALHGYVMLEIAGIYRAEDGTTEQVLDPLLSRLLAVPVTMGH